MVLGSPSIRTVEQLIFWSGDERPEGSDIDPDDGPDLDASKVLHEKQSQSKWQSMYVTLFEDMLKTVLEYEPFLFSETELDCFGKYASYPYRARYLFVRLCLRKVAKWHRIASLKYQSELGENVVDAMRELCYDASQSHSTTVKEEEREIIDLTMDGVDEAGPSGYNSHTQHAKTGEPRNQSNLKMDIIQRTNTADLNLTTFAEDDSHATLPELLDSLLTKELMDIAKQMKVKANAKSKRSSLISLLLSSAATQSTLSFPTIAKGKGNTASNHLRQTTLPFGLGQKTKVQTSRLRQMALKILGPCIRINDGVLYLFRRVNLVFFRSTQHSPTLLTPSLLSTAKKCAYPPYEYKRTSDIWPSREALLAYEEALELESRVDELLGGISRPSPRGRSVASKTPALTQVNEDCASQAPEALDGEYESSRMQSASQVKKIFETIYYKWTDVVHTKGEEGSRPNGLERFDCGHVLTRIVYKGAHALGVLKQYDYELKVLDSLLSQRRWRRGRRGEWHDRRALILTNHFPKDEETLKRAMDAVIEALEDNDTHLIYRPKLERRLTSLEKLLDLQQDERHTCEGRLQKPKHVDIEGVRVRHKAASLALDQTGRCVNKPVANVKPIDDNNLSRQTLLSGTNKNGLKAKSREKSKSDASTGKSVWLGRDGDEVTVELLALQYYEKLGYCGFHTESAIVRTLFGLLFWDILFSNVPGAFETPYQSAPLDIAEDSFYFAREHLIETRLTQIEQGEARAILEAVDDEHRPQSTWCVGVRWDLFAKQDLMEIVDCLGGRSLSIICRLLCEDYAARGSGVPDLIVWSTELGECKFVEVKGPGDRLQENQTIWINVLLRAGTAVEVCRVQEQGQLVGATKNKERRKTRRKMKAEMETDSDSQAVMLESEDEQEPMPTPDISQRRLSGSKRSLEDVDSNTTHSPKYTRRMRQTVEVVITVSPSKKRRISQSQ